MGKKKKLKDLMRAKHVALVEETTVPPQPPVEQFLQSYAELTDATVALYRKLTAEDPVRAQVHDVLVHAQEMLAPVVAGADAQRDELAAAIEAAQVAPAPGMSLELVRTSSTLPVVQPPRLRSHYPDQATLVRYFHNRRLTGPHYPDQAALVKYFRHRRQTGPHYPDEAVIPRYFRRRRELYALSM